AQRPAVGEAAVNGVHDGIKGQKPVAYGMLTAEEDMDPGQLTDGYGAKLPKEYETVAAASDCEVVSALPKTRSDKIIRRTRSTIVEGDEVAAPATIEDPGVLEAFAGQTRRWEN